MAYERIPEAIQWRIGYAADPAIDILLDKALLAQLRVRKLDIAIADLKSQMELLQLERGMLAREYKIK